MTGAVDELVALFTLTGVRSVLIDAVTRSTNVQRLALIDICRSSMATQHRNKGQWEAFSMANIQMRTRLQGANRQYIEILKIKKIKLNLRGKWQILKF